MAEALKSIHTLNPEHCRQAAREQFSAERMVKGYFDAYSQILQRSDRAGSGVPARQMVFA